MKLSMNSIYEWTEDVPEMKVRYKAKHNTKKNHKQYNASPREIARALSDMEMRSEAELV